MISRLLTKLIPPWIVGALWLRWWLTFDPATLAIAGMAAVVELILWAQRLVRAGIARSMLTGQPAQLERQLQAHPGVMIAALVVFGVLIDLGRVAYAIGAFLWWGIGFPTVLVNRQRYARAQAQRQAVLAQRIIDGAGSQAHVAAGASMKARALQVLQGHLGLAPGHEVAPVRRPPALETVERPFDSLEERPALPAAEPAAAIAQVAIIHGLVETYDDGSHRFEPMAVETNEARR